MRWNYRVTLCRTILAVIFSACMASSAYTQHIGKSDPHLFDHVPFDQWLAEGPREQIPFKVRTYDAELSVYQRLVTHLEMTIHGKELSRRGNNGDLLGFLQITDSSGHNYRDALKLELVQLNPDMRNSDILFGFDAFVLPGTYSVSLALHHTGTAEHSLEQRTIHVSPLKNDPLPDAWRDLPAVEILTHIEPPDPDTYFHPELKGRLHLPAANQKPLHIELLADVTPSELFHGSSTRYMRYLYALAPAVGVFSQIQLRVGSKDVATLDLTRRKVVFEQDEMKELDWNAWKKTLSAGDATMVSVGNLSKQLPKPEFLREELARRISAHSNDQAMQVFIVITSTLFRYSFHLEQASLPQNCNCLIFYIAYDSSRHVSAFGATGQVEKMLKPVNVRSFRVHSPETVRHALAKIIDEISRL